MWRSIQPGKFGFVSDGGSNDVLVFDRHSFATVATVPAGTNPDGIVFEPVTQTAWAFNGRTNNVTVVDAATKSAVATIALPGKPEFPVADGKGFVYDNIESANSIVKLDARTRTLVATWKLDKCESPSGLAIDRAHGRLFAVCDGNSMAVVDTTSGKQIATAQIGNGPDAARFSAKHQLAFSSNGDGTLSVVDAAHGFKTIQTLTTKKGARTMAYEDTTDRLFFSTAEYGPKPEPTADHPRPRPAVLPRFVRDRCGWPLSSVADPDDPAGDVVRSAPLLRKFDQPFANDVCRLCVRGEHRLGEVRVVDVARQAIGAKQNGCRPAGASRGNTSGWNIRLSANRARDHRLQRPKPLPAPAS